MGVVIAVLEAVIYLFKGVGGVLRRHASLGGPGGQGLGHRIAHQGVGKQAQTDDQGQGRHQGGHLQMFFLHGQSSFFSAKHSRAAMIMPAAAKPE